MYVVLVRTLLLPSLLSSYPPATRVIPAAGQTMLLLLPTWYWSLVNWWPTVVSFGSDSTDGSWNDIFAAAFVMWASTELTFWSVNLFFFSIEYFGLFAKHRIHKEGSDMSQFAETLLHKPITYLVDVPIYLLTAWSSAAAGKTVHEPLPGAAEIATQVLIATLTFDFMFYWWHRNLHSKLMWPYHKKHHEVKVVYASANDHEDILEVSGNILWKMLPPIVMKSHVYTVCVFRSVVKFFALLHHSGYELPVFQPLQAIPFMSSPANHDFHHYIGHSNYGGVFMLWDYIFGTYTTWDERAQQKGHRASLVSMLTVREKVAASKKQYEEFSDEALIKLACQKVQAEDGPSFTKRRRASILKVVNQ